MREAVITGYPDHANCELLDMGALPMLESMERTGMLVDLPHFSRLSKKLGLLMGELTDWIEYIGGHRINPASGDQVADLLFRKIKIDVKGKIRMTPSGEREQVDKDNLEQYRHLHPVIPYILEFREVDKLRNTYAEVLPTHVRNDGRIHPRFKYTFVETGRYSCDEPNLLAIPTRTKLGAEIRKGFVVPKGKLFGSIDASQIELRLVAHESGCQAMIDAFLKGLDIHAATASLMFGLPIEKLDKKEHRAPAKNVNFGVVYGITAEGLLDQMKVAHAKGWDLDRCEKTIARWYEVYPEILIYMRDQYTRARRYGYVWDMWGRIRFVPEVKSVHTWIQSGGLRQAGNFPIQAGAAGILKLMMKRLQERIDNYWGDWIKPLLPVHDEINIEGEAEAVEEFMKEAEEIGSKLVELSVPVKWEYGLGQSWAEAKG